MTSVIPSCSNDSAAVEVVARSYDDIRSGDRSHSTLLIRIDYTCVGNDGQQVRDNLQICVYKDQTLGRAQSSVVTTIMLSIYMCSACVKLGKEVAV